jgi:hypothetical protein
MIEHPTKSNSQNRKKVGCSVQHTFNVENPIMLDVQSMLDVNNPKNVLDFCWINWIEPKKSNPIIQKSNFLDFYS